MQEPSASPQSGDDAQAGEQAQPTASQTGDAAQANANALTYYTDFRNERKTNREQQIAGWIPS